MNVLIVGSGAREHALALSVSKSALIGRLYVAPGNPGCEQVAQTVDLPIERHYAIVEFCRREQIDFVVIGPEAPLVAGLVDDLADAGILAFGPSREAARLEGSKGFTKDLCRELGIPTADYRRFRDRNSAQVYVRNQGVPIVIKADGLASGKGVVVATSHLEAQSAVDALYDADPSSECVVEQFLRGDEVSYFALCDGERAVPFGHAQDHKRVGDGDTGPNTGGMGAFSPSPLIDKHMSERIMAEIVRPTLVGMKARGAPFQGILFAGLMLTESGPKLIEFNVRFGDPETEVLLPRFDGDLLLWLSTAAKGRLVGEEPPFSNNCALTVTIAAQGYPVTPILGGEILGIEQANAVDNVRVFQGGTRRHGNQIVASGGRVLAVTCVADKLEVAREGAYDAVRMIDFPSGFFRRDIGLRTRSA